MRGFTFDSLVAFFQGVRRLVQMLSRTVDALTQLFGPLPYLVALRANWINRTRRRRTVLAHHQP
ncbi:hypothetical protein D9M71_828350 [compost metagenome]